MEETAVFIAEEGNGQKRLASDVDRCGGKSNRGTVLARSDLAVSCSTEARLRHNNVISQYNEYTLVLRYNILVCPSRAEDEQHSKEAAHGRGREAAQGARQA